MDTLKFQTTWAEGNEAAEFRKDFKAESDAALAGGRGMFQSTLSSFMKNFAYAGNIGLLTH